MGMPRFDTEYCVCLPNRYRGQLFDSSLQVFTNELYILSNNLKIHNVLHIFGIQMVSVSDWAFTNTSYSIQISYSCGDSMRTNRKTIHDMIKCCNVITDS